jgi:hypothetical protein
LLCTRDKRTSSHQPVNINMPFDYEEYEQKCATMAPEALQKEWENYTRQISGGATSTAGSVLFAPITGGASLVGLGLSTPRIHNARKKHEIIEAALQKHGLTHSTRKRDVFVPMTVAGTLGGLTLGLAGPGADMIAGQAVGHGVEYVMSHAALEVAGASLEHAHDDHKKTKEQLKLVQAGHSIGEVKKKDDHDGLTYGYAYGIEKPQKIPQGPEQEYGPVPVPPPYDAPTITKPTFLPQEAPQSQMPPPPYQPSQTPQQYLAQIQQQEPKVEATSPSQSGDIAGVQSSPAEKYTVQTPTWEIIDSRPAIALPKSEQQLVLQWDESRGVYVLAQDPNSRSVGTQPIITVAQQIDSKAANAVDSAYQVGVLEPHSGPRHQLGRVTEAPQASVDSQIEDVTHMIAELMGDNPTLHHEEADLYGVDGPDSVKPSQRTSDSMHDAQHVMQKLKYYPPPPPLPSAPQENTPDLPPRPVSTQGTMQAVPLLTPETTFYPPPPPRPHSSNQNLPPTQARPTSQIHYLSQHSPILQQQQCGQGQPGLPPPPPRPLSWGASNQIPRPEQHQEQALLNYQPNLPSYQPASHHQQYQPQQYQPQPAIYQPQPYRPHLPQRPTPQPIQQAYDERQQSTSSISSAMSPSPSLSLTSTVSPLSTPLTTYSSPTPSTYDPSCGTNSTINGSVSPQPMYFPPPPSAAAGGKGRDYFSLGKLDSKRLSWNGSVGAPVGTVAGEPSYGIPPPVPQAYK